MDSVHIWDCWVVPWEEALSSLLALPVKRWRYRSNPDLRHPEVPRFHQRHEGSGVEYPARQLLTILPHNFHHPRQIPPSAEDRRRSG